MGWRNLMRFMFVSFLSSLCSGVHGTARRKAGVSTLRQMHTDSDEEAAAMCTAAARDAFQRAAVPNVSSPYTSHAATELSALRKQLCMFGVAVPDVVNFCVDGKCFSVRRELLLKDPQSVLFLMTEEHFRRRKAGCSVDEFIEIPCRSPLLFGMLLNVLRGYRDPVPEKYREACYAEARFYGLLRSWALRYPLVVDGPFRPLFCGNQLTSDTLFATVGSFCSSGKYTVKLSVVRCDRIGVGVITGDMEKLWMGATMEWQGFAFYWNDGRMVCNFGSPVAEEIGFVYSNGSQIRVDLDCDEKTVSWALPGKQNVAIARLPTSCFSFAVAMGKCSELQVVGVD
uniref:Uncharacterized protein TCIL3000_8_7010 n=1 Tax=Trypanosoma congolense (strain IL3000) TaxID=1068625 RepID=G0USW0_TRYCI|nr:unnamed protein product [Trypanosoma congolense IL3000]